MKSESAALANPHVIVIVGGGAAGLELATALGNRSSRSSRPATRIVLVDRLATHIWKPLLHEVAAGSMDPNTHQLAYAAQARWHGFEFQQGDLTGLTRSSRTLRVGAVADEDGVELLPAREIHYDTLVLAIGSVTNFFSVPGAAQWAMALDTAQQAERFRRRLVASCVRAQRTESSEAVSGRARISVAIIGAGATGVELSAELRNTAHVLKAYGVHNLDARNDLQICVVEAGPRVLPALPERVSRSVEGLLAKANVAVLCEERVTEVTADSVHTASGKVIPSDLTVWAAGIIAPAVLATLDGLAVNRLGQLTVGTTLQVDGDPDIFALGDCASCPWTGHAGTVPPRAQAAHQQASFLARALRLRLQNEPLPHFAFRDFGSLVSLGHMDAAGSLMGGLIGGSLLIEGLFARLMYASLYRMHIMALHGVVRMIFETLAQWLLRRTTPRVKLH
jgi:NADH dehydrogenase